MFQSKYRESAKKESSTSLYHTLAETKDTQHARDAAEIQSEVRHSDFLCFRFGADWVRSASVFLLDR